MEIAKVTREDGINCAALVDIISFSTKLADALKIAGISLAGPGFAKRDEAKQWLHQLAIKMSTELKKQEEDNKPMTVKSIGQPQKLSKSKKKR